MGVFHLDRGWGCRNDGQGGGNSSSSRGGWRTKGGRRVGIVTGQNAQVKVLCEVVVRVVWDDLGRGDGLDEDEKEREIVEELLIS